MAFQSGNIGSSRQQTRKPRSAKRRQLFFEQLETRTLLSGTGLAGISAVPFVSTAPTAFTGPYNPSQIRQAYNFGTTGSGSGQTIAVIDAYNDPNALHDLNTFDATFGLPVPPNFLQVSETGGSTSRLPVNSGWAMETSLDIEWAHAIAPAANILLVEANSTSLNDLLTAVNLARNASLRTPQGLAPVTVVSMSWGAGEFSSEASYDSYFTTPAGHAGVSFVAATGDNGAPGNWPAFSPNVLAVGGTSLTTANSSGAYQSEAAWNDSGGGVSLYEAEPSYQTSVQTTGKRTTPDVSLNAAPNTGYYVYDSVPYNGLSGWWEVGGTSASTPIWGATIAIADQSRMANGLNSLSGAQANVYSLPTTDFHAVTSAGNGITYNATTGYNSVTGIGSPIANLVINGLIGLTPSSSGKPASLTGRPSVTLHRAVDHAGGDDGRGSGSSIPAMGATSPAPLASGLDAETANLSSVLAASDSPLTPMENGGANSIFLADAPLVMSNSSAVDAPAGLPAADIPLDAAARATDYLLEHGTVAATVFGGAAPFGSHARHGDASTRASDSFFLPAASVRGDTRAESSALEIRAVIGPADNRAATSASTAGDDASAVDEARARDAALAVFAWYGTKAFRNPRAERQRDRFPLSLVGIRERTTP